MLIGITLICGGLMVAMLTYKTIIKKKLSLVWGGYNLFMLSLFLIAMGVYLSV
ncbi:MAG: hypothetical protein JJU02_12725 [Cryomorphaceae bacterium]|nr:hypothetical protein [Cryomorphaceae bacterium]